MAVKYDTRVMSVGEMAAAFAAEGILVFFGPQAPEELHDFAIITEACTLDAPVAVGDELQIDGNAYPVVGVGSVANDNLSGLGHLVVKFNGLVDTELPGDVSVPEGPAPQVSPGSHIKIEGDI